MMHGARAPLTHITKETHFFVGVPSILTDLNGIATFI